MPIVIRGRHRCEYCQKVYTWVNFKLIRTPLSSGYMKVEAIPSEPQVRRAEPIGNGKYRIEMNCPECGKYNIFEYSEEEECEA